MSHSDPPRRPNPDSARDDGVDPEVTTNWEQKPPGDQSVEPLPSPAPQFDPGAFHAPARPVQPALMVMGSFRIQRRLGVGGYGVVYLAEDPVLGRHVAIKVPHASMLVSQDDQDRFVQEAKIVATLRHSHIVEIFQVGADETCRFLVFEYCAGGSLAEWLAKHPTSLSPRECAEVILLLARAVDYAHQQGVAHRDVNPRNVLLVPLLPEAATPANKSFPFIPKLSDFGLGTWLDESRTAVHTQTGAVMGTLPYMAPEQTRADQTILSTSVDIYALGVILYEMLTGVRPFAGPTPIETLRMIREADPVSLRHYHKPLPRDLETICLKCLEKSPASRYGFARLLAEDLELFLAGEPIRARRVSVLGKGARWIGKHRLQAATWSIVTVCLGLLLWGGVWLSGELSAARGQGLQLLKVSDASTTRLKQAQANEQELKLAAKRQAELVRSLSYIDHVQLISGLVEKRPFDAVQMLREWIPQAPEPDLRGFEWFYLMQAAGGDIVPSFTTADLLDNYNCLHLSDDRRQLFLSNPRRGHEGVSGWEIASGRPLSPRFPFEKSVPDFAVSRKHNQLLAVLGGTSIIDVQDLLPGVKPRRVTLTMPDELVCYRILRHPARPEVLSIGSADHEFHVPSEVIWHSLETGHVLGALHWPLQRVFDAVIHPGDASTIIAVDNSIEVYNRERVKIQELKLSDREPLRTLALSPDGTHLAVSTDQQRILACRRDSQGLWQLVAATPQNSVLVRHPDNRLFLPWNSVGFDSTGRYLFFTQQQTLVMAAITDHDQLREVARFPEIDARQLEPLPDGMTAVWSTMRTWGLWRPIPRIAPVAGHDKEAWAVAYSHKGLLLASGSDDETVRLWNPGTGEQLGELKGHIATITEVGFSPDDSLLATASLDGTVKIWDVASRQLVRTLENGPTQVRAMTWFADGKRLVSGDSPQAGLPQRVLIWDVEEGSILHSLPGFTDRIQSVLITADQKLLIGSSDDLSIRTFRLDGRHPADTAWRKWSSDSAGRCAVLIDQERQLATGHNNGVIHIWDMATGTKRPPLNGHIDSVVCLAMSPDGRVLASGGKDRSIYVWDIQTGRRLLALKDLSAQVNGLAFSPSGDILTAALHDGKVQHFYAPRFHAIQFER